MPVPEDRLETVEHTLYKIYGELRSEFTASRTLTENIVKRIGGQEITLNEHVQVLRDHTARLDRMEAMLAQILLHLKETPSASSDTHENADSETIRPEEVQPKRGRTFFERLMGFYPEDTETEKS